MPKLKFTKADITIIVLFFVLYAFGYAWLIEPKEKSESKKCQGFDRVAVTRIFVFIEPRSRKSIFKIFVFHFFQFLFAQFRYFV